MATNDGEPPAVFPGPPPSDPLFHELSQFDQFEYHRLAQFFAQEDAKNSRIYGVTAFIHHLSVIHRFVVQGNRDDVLRGIICGIEFTQFALLVNTGKLKSLMGRSKSCMNGCFQKLGYKVVRPAGDLSCIFGQIFPRYTAASGLVGRNWCIRKLTYEAAVCFIPNLHINLLDLELSTAPPKENEIRAPMTEHLEIMHDSTASQDAEDFTDEVGQLLNRKTPLAPIRCSTDQFFHRVS
jgi:hypothetical protein